MEPTLPQPKIRQGWLRVLVFIVPYLIVAGAFQFLAIVFISLISGDSFQAVASNTSALHDLDNFLVLEFFLMIGSIVIIAVFMNFIDRQPLLSLGLQFQGRSKELLLGVSLGAVIMGIGVLILVLFNLYSIEQIIFLAPNFFSSIILCILISISEELVVRGYVLKNLLQSFPNYSALILSSILFASLHAFNPNLSLIGMINLFLAGVLLGASYIYTKNLWFPIGLHFGWNFFQGPIFGFNVSGIELQAVIIRAPVNEQLWSGGNFGFEGSLLASVLSLVAIIVVIGYFKHKSEKNILEKDAHSSVRSRND